MVPPTPDATRYIGIRELKSRLSECVREVKAGYVVVVTEHGRPVARMVPETPAVAERLDALVQSGSLHWSGKRLKPRRPAGKVVGPRTVADLLSENRN